MRGAWLAGGLLVACVSAAHGETLQLSTPCVSSVTVVTDPSRPDTYTSSATVPGQDRDDLPHYTFRQESGAWVLRAGCSSDAKIEVRVPHPMDVVIADGGQTAFHIDRAASLSATSTGSENMTAGEVGNLTLLMRGIGDVKVGQVTGRADITVRGSGDVTIDEIASPSTNILLSGVGDVRVHQGTIDTLTVRSSGAGKIGLDVTANTASLISSGVGNISLSRVSRSLYRSVTGWGDVTVADTSGAQVSDHTHRSGEPDAVPPIPPIPPVPPIPPIPALPTASQLVVHHHQHSPLKAVLEVGVTLAIAWQLARILQRRRAAARPAPTQTRTHDPEMIALTERLSALEPRIARLERLVSTREFDLRRKFRDLEASD